MKIKLIIFAVALAALTSIAQTPPPPPASQAEVNAGTVKNKYVSPATLAGTLSGGGLTGPQVIGLLSRGVPTVSITNALGTNTWFLDSLVTTNLTENTNVMFVSGFGTAASNGRYQIYIYLPLWGGWIMTNAANVHVFLTKDLRGGYDADTILQNPLYIGPNTNNDTTDYYFSGVNERIGWLNADVNDFFQLAGSLPIGSVRYGTNTVLTTNTVLVGSLDVPRRLASKAVMVDPVYGDDNGGWKGETPFKSGTAAVQYAPAGSTIFVMPPGLTNNYGLIKNGVNWKFEKGATLAGFAPRWGTNQLGFFDDRFTGAVTSTIEGDSIHYFDAQVFHATPITITNEGSQVTFTFNSADPEFVNWSAQGCDNLATYSGGAQGGMFAQVINAHRVNFHITTTEVQHDGENFSIVDSFGPGPTPSTYAQQTNVPIAGPTAMYYWRSGEEHFDGDSAIQSPLGTYVIWSDTQLGNDETQFYIRLNKMGGLFYNDGQNSNSFTSFDVLEATNATGSVFRGFDNAKTYLKLGVVGGGNAQHAVIESLNNAQMWVTAQKIKSSFEWLNLAGAFASINIQHYQDTGGSVSNGIVLAGAFVDIQGGEAAAKGSVISAGGSGQEIHIRDMILSSTNNSPILINGAGVHLHGVSLVTPSAWTVAATATNNVTIDVPSSGNKPMTNVGQLFPSNHWP